MRAIAPRTLTLLMIVSSFAVRPAHATEPFAKVRSYGATWLTLPRGVRNIGMGATGTADASGLGTGYFNPAVTAYNDATILTSSYEQFIDGQFDVSDVSLSSPIPFRSDSTTSAWRFSGGVGYARLGMQPQTMRTIFLPGGTANTFDADEWMLTGLGATSWTSRGATVAVGATGKYLHSKIGSESSDVWALDWGTLVAWNIDLGDGASLRPRAGFAVLNLDAGGSYDDGDYNVANETRAGLGFDVSTPEIAAWSQRVPAVKLSIDYDFIDTETNSSRDYAAGFEVVLVNFMHLRYGTVASNDTTYGVGLGWDWGNVLFRADYAHHGPDGFLSEMLKRDTAGVVVGMRW